MQNPQNQLHPPNNNGGSLTIWIICAMILCLVAAASGAAPAPAPAGETLYHHTTLGEPSDWSNPAVWYLDCDPTGSSPAGRIPGPLDDVVVCAGSPIWPRVLSVRQPGAECATLVTPLFAAVVVGDEADLTLHGGLPQPGQDATHNFFGAGINAGLFIKPGGLVTFRGQDQSVQGRILLGDIDGTLPAVVRIEDMITVELMGGRIGGAGVVGPVTGTIYNDGLIEASDGDLLLGCRLLDPGLGFVRYSTTPTGNLHFLGLQNLNLGASISLPWEGSGMTVSDDLRTTGLLLGADHQVTVEPDACFEHAAGELPPGCIITGPTFP